MNTFRPALIAHLIHVLLCIIWNGVGLWQQAHGLKTIGPTASWGAIGFVILLGAGLVGLSRKGPPLGFLALSAIGMLLAVVAIHGGLTKDASNWPSEFWRWAGIVVNSFGVIGFLLALATYLRRKSTIS
jgi:hypothetical protein